MEYEIDTDESASVAVVRAIAAYTETEPEELDPLYWVIDPEALDTVISRTTTSVRVQFEYEGVSVTVNPERVILDDGVGKNG